jgi:hypothetical protein
MSDNTDLIARLLEIADAYDTSLENDIWCEDELREAADALAARDAEIQRLREWRADALLVLGTKDTRELWPTSTADLLRRAGDTFEVTE